MHLKLNEFNVILESLLASPMLTIFANLIPIDDSLKVLDRFILGKFLLRLIILDGENSIIEIMKHLLR
jgi:hypothetical protein